MIGACEALLSFLKYLICDSVNLEAELCTPIHLIWKKIMSPQLGSLQHSQRELADQLQVTLGVHNHS